MRPILSFEMVFELLNVVVVSSELVAEGVVFGFKVGGAQFQCIVRRTAFFTLL